MAKNPIELNDDERRMYDEVTLRANGDLQLIIDKAAEGVLATDDIHVAAYHCVTLVEQLGGIQARAALALLLLRTVLADRDAAA